MGKSKQLIRAFVDTFPPLRVAMKLYDWYILAVKSIAHFIWSIIRFIFNQILSLLIYFRDTLSRLVGANEYQRLEAKQKDEPQKDHVEPLPYRNDLFKRSLTYHGGIILGLLLYGFVYYVIIKNHSYTTISVAVLLMVAYFIILENSHSIRSIVMLSLPIMFTNRGRALVFCLMLTMMLAGPLRNSQLNVNEIHLSLNCCKQYLLVKTDKSLEDNVIRQVEKIEEITVKLIQSIKKFATDLKKRFEHLIKLALSIQQYIQQNIEKLMRIVNICNSHKNDAQNNCKKTFEHAYQDCKYKLGSTFDVLCKVVEPLISLCDIVKLPGLLCEIPKQVVEFLDNTVGERLRHHLKIIQNEFYVDVDIDHIYYYNGTKSKRYRKVVNEIKFDVKQKFWYIHIFSGMFKLVSLVLVCWILITATLYHMHYLTEPDYDNIYIDDYLVEIEERRKVKMEREIVSRRTNDESPLLESDPEESQLLNPSSDIEETNKQKQNTLLFPMNQNHEKQYFKPFSIWMNKTERHKLYIAGLVWFVIMGYIFFFVLLDFSLFKLIELLENVLNDILFKSDLPIVDVSSQAGDGRVVYYNRTYISYLRSKNKNQTRDSSQEFKHRSSNNSSIGAMYRRLMDSIRDNVPDDVEILDSLQQCLPKAVRPNYNQYLHLLYLACFTFLAVIMEAYAMRTRHCIANLYYPRKARQRAVWLYRKLLKEKRKFTYMDKIKQKDDDNKLNPLFKQIIKAYKR